MNDEPGTQSRSLSPSTSVLPTLVLSIVSVATGSVTVIGAVEVLSPGSVSGVPEVTTAVFS